MTDCYIYTRVSTSKQVTEGNGLDSQLRRCLNYAKDNNYNVIKTYKEEGNLVELRGVEPLTSTLPV